jgi:hypothetical protein
MFKRMFNLLVFFCAQQVTVIPSDVVVMDLKELSKEMVSDSEWIHEAVMQCCPIWSLLDEFDSCVE